MTVTGGSGGGGGAGGAVTVTGGSVDAEAAALLELDALPAGCRLMFVDGGTFAPLCAAWDAAQK